MSRIRNVKPEYFKSEKIGDLPRDARLLFIALWTQADLNGVFEWRPRSLKIEVFPWDNDITPERIEALLAALVVAGLVASFMADGKKYGAIHDWKDHQAISQVEKVQRQKAVDKARPVFPEPPTDIDTEPVSDQNQTEPVSEPTRNTGRHDQGDVDQGHHDVVTSEARESAETTTTAATRSSEQDEETTLAPHEDINRPPIDGPLPGPGNPQHLTTAIVHRVDAVDDRAVRSCAKAGDLIGVVRAFGGNLSGDRAGEWRREADGLAVLSVVALLAEARFHRNHIREPSGLREARRTWFRELPQSVVLELLALYGLKPPGPARAAAGGAP